MKPKIGGEAPEVEHSPMDPLMLVKQLVLLVVEARTPDFSKGRKEGPHCPAIKGPSGHVCFPEKAECKRANDFCCKAEKLWTNRIPVCIDILLFPDCQHGRQETMETEGAVTTVSQENALLVERWMFDSRKRRHEQGLTSSLLLQAVRSYVHFSQISSWLFSCHGKLPCLLAYRIYCPGEESSIDFLSAPESHVFPVCITDRLSIQVKVSAMKRREEIPKLTCAELRVEIGMVCQSDKQAKANASGKMSPYYYLEMSARGRVRHQSLDGDSAPRNSAHHWQAASGMKPVSSSPVLTDVKQVIAMKQKEKYEKHTGHRKKFDLNRTRPEGDCIVWENLPRFGGGRKVKKKDGEKDLRIEQMKGLWKYSFLDDEEEKAKRDLLDDLAFQFEDMTLMPTETESKLKALHRKQHLSQKAQESRSAYWYTNEKLGEDSVVAHAAYERDSQRKQKFSLWKSKKNAKNTSIHSIEAKEEDFIQKLSDRLTVTYVPIKHDAFNIRESSDIENKWLKSDYINKIVKNENLTSSTSSNPQGCTNSDTKVVHMNKNILTNAIDNHLEKNDSQGIDLCSNFSHATSGIYRLDKQPFSQLTIDVNSHDLDGDSDDTPKASPNQLSSSRSNGDSLFRSVLEKQIAEGGLNFPENKQKLEDDRSSSTLPQIEQSSLNSNVYDKSQDSNVTNVRAFEVESAPQDGPSNSCSHTLVKNETMPQHQCGTSFKAEDHKGASQQGLNNTSNPETLLQTSSVSEPLTALMTQYPQQTPLPQELINVAGPEAASQKSSRKIFQDNLLPLVSYDEKTDSYKQVEQSMSLNILHSPKVLFSCDVPGEKASSEGRKCINFGEDIESEFFASRFHDILSPHLLHRQISQYTSELANLSNNNFGTPERGEESFQGIDSLGFKLNLPSIEAPKQTSEVTKAFQASDTKRLQRVDKTESNSDTRSAEHFGDTKHMERILESKVKARHDTESLVSARCCDMEGVENSIDSVSDENSGIVSARKKGKTQMKRAADTKCAIDMTDVYNEDLNERDLYQVKDSVERDLNETLKKTKVRKKESVSRTEPLHSMVGGMDVPEEGKTFEFLEESKSKRQTGKALHNTDINSDIRLFQSSESQGMANAMGTGLINVRRQLTYDSVVSNTDDSFNGHDASDLHLQNGVSRRNGEFTVYDSNMLPNSLNNVERANGNTSSSPQMSSSSSSPGSESSVILRSSPPLKMSSLSFASSDTNKIASDFSSKSKTIFTHNSGENQSEDSYPHSDTAHLIMCPEQLPCAKTFISEGEPFQNGNASLTSNSTIGKDSGFSSDRSSQMHQPSNDVVSSCDGSLTFNSNLIGQPVDENSHNKVPCRVSTEEDVLFPSQEICLSQTDFSPNEFQGSTQISSTAGHLGGSSIDRATNHTLPEMNSHVQKSCAFQMTSNQDCKSLVSNSHSKITPGANIFTDSLNDDKDVIFKEDIRNNVFSYQPSTSTPSDSIRGEKNSLSKWHESTDDVPYYMVKPLTQPSQPSLSNHFSDTSANSSSGLLTKNEGSQRASAKEACSFTKVRIDQVNSVRYVSQGNWQTNKPVKRAWNGIDEQMSRHREFQEDSPSKNASKPLSTADPLNHSADVPHKKPLLTAATSLTDHSHQVQCQEIVSLESNGNLKENPRLTAIQSSISIAKELDGKRIHSQHKSHKTSNGYAEPEEEKQGKYPLSEDEGKRKFCDSDEENEGSTNYLDKGKDDMGLPKFEDSLKRRKSEGIIFYLRENNDEVDRTQASSLSHSISSSSISSSEAGRDIFSSTTPMSQGCQIPRSTSLDDEHAFDVADSQESFEKVVRSRLASYNENALGWNSSPPSRSVSTPNCSEQETRGRMLQRSTSSRTGVFHVATTGNLENQYDLRKMAMRSTSMIFNSRTALPTQSSPAPLKRKSGNSFGYDPSLVNVRTIKNAFSCSKLLMDDKNNTGEKEDRCRTLSTSAPASTNCLLGNFEESILNGRIDPVGTVEGFSAEIGASGSFCPTHVHLPVSAFFFSLSEDNAPSPYLGHIDLIPMSKKGYHIPKKGTLQVTLFNPNKTVVKMFVVMYDLSDMPPSSQTFIRQRTMYIPRDPNSTAPSYLRYLIHLRCASSRSGKIYLHTDIRLIFARHKLDIDAKTVDYEMKSFTEVPKNPKYSPKK